MERRIALSSRSTCVLPVRTLVHTLIPRDVGISSTSAGRAIVPRRVYGVQPREVAGGAVGWRGNWGGDCCWEKGWLRSRKKRWSAQLVENNIEEKEESGGRSRGPKYETAELLREIKETPTPCVHVCML